MENIKKFIETNNIIYDKEGQCLFVVQKNGHHQMIGVIRGWGAIQKLFNNMEVAEDFQDQLGQFIADAIKEKLEKDYLNTPTK
jgi:hypothetical protein